MIGQVPGQVCTQGGVPLGLGLTNSDGLLSSPAGGKRQCRPSVADSFRLPHRACEAREYRITLQSVRLFVDVD